MEIKNNDVWVFIEQRNGKTADVSFELLSKGRKLANSLKSSLKAIILGHNVKPIAEETFKYGVEEAIIVDDEKLAHYLTVPYSRVLNDLVEKYNPRVMLYGATVI